MIYLNRCAKRIEVKFTHEQELQRFLVQGDYPYAACKLKSSRGLFRHWWFAKDHESLIHAVLGTKKLDFRYDSKRLRWRIENLDSEQWFPLVESLWCMIGDRMLGPDAVERDLYQAVWETIQVFDEIMECKVFGPAEHMIPECQLNAQQFLQGPAKFNSLYV